MEISLYPRHAERKLLAALDAFPAVLIHGPRQCGKTTLASMISEVRDYALVDFNLHAARENARRDPDGFAAGLPERVILDEVQLVPELFAPLRVEIDRHRVPGRFLMTGSSNVLLLPKLADSLTGRLAIRRLHPLSQCELERTEPTFLDTLFAADFSMQTTEPLLRKLAERVVKGGYPAALAQPTTLDRIEWLRDYLETLAQRDVKSLRNIHALDVVPKLLKLAAAQSAQLLNVAGISVAFELSRPTIRDYLSLLRHAFVLDHLPAWHHKQATGIVKRPKMHLGDTGLACTLLGVSAPELYAPHLDRRLFGHLLETFAFQELHRQASASRDHVDFFHYREKSGMEVDIVLKRGSQLAGVEVKAAATTGPEDFRGLKRFQELAGERFACGVLLYDGHYCLRFGDRLHAVPIRYLWENAEMPAVAPA